MDNEACPNPLNLQIIFQSLAKVSRVTCKQYPKDSGNQKAIGVNHMTMLLISV